MNNHQQQPQQSQQMGSGLTRYRSAPSSYFASLLDTPDAFGFGADDFEQVFNPRACSPETQRIFSRFMNTADTLHQSTEFLPPAKNEPDLQQINDYTSSPYQTHNSEENSHNKLWGSSFNSNMKMEATTAAAAANSGLIRHSSSPAGLFANINIENEFGLMKGAESFGDHNNGNAEISFSTSGSKFGKDPSFPVNSWDDPTNLPDNFLNDQSNEGGSRPTTMLSHHLSLPKNSSDLYGMEKLLQDSVPCKIRAKRGCATHPRSIAERVRRTKISERMRKLQELVPNMEKQTNTSDMLDLAVDYIKDLQKHVERLSDNREKCTCSAKQQS